MSGSSPFGTQAVGLAQLWFPAKLPGATTDQVFDISALIPPVDATQIETLSAQIAPSGTGELSATALVVADAELTITLTGGVPTRVYAILFTAALTGGEVAQWIIYQGVPPDLVTDHAGPALDPGFGTPVTWRPPTD